MDITGRGAKANPHDWVKLFSDSLFQYALPRVNDRAVAEDLVQETFLSALKGLEGFKGEASEKSWLFAILKNKIIDHYRRKALEITDPVPEEADDRFLEDGHWTLAARPKSWKDMENPAERKDLQRIIDLCKERLKDLQQKVFILKYLEDMDSDGICKVLNISSSNYWVIIHRARLQMRDCIDKNWFRK